MLSQMHNQICIVQKRAFVFVPEHLTPGYTVVFVKPSKSLLVIPSLVHSEAKSAYCSVWILNERQMNVCTNNFSISHSNALIVHAPYKCI